MITRAGLTRFWIGTVLIVLCTIGTLVPARIAAHEPAPWWIGIGAGLLCLACCIALWRWRLAGEADAMRVDLPRYEPVSVIVGLALLADFIFVIVELYNQVQAHRIGEFWLWLPGALIFIGITLVFSLGDYAP